MWGAKHLHGKIKMLLNHVISSFKLTSHSPLKLAASPATNTAWHLSYSASMNFRLDCKWLRLLESGRRVWGSQRKIKTKTRKIFNGFLLAVWCKDLLGCWATWIVLPQVTSKGAQLPGFLKQTLQETLELDGGLAKKTQNRIWEVHHIYVEI